MAKKKATAKKRASKKSSSVFAELIDAHSDFELPKSWSAEDLYADKTPIAKRRGIGYIDADGEYSVILVRSPVADVAKVIQKRWDATWHKDTNSTPIKLQHQIALVLQIKGQTWTTVSETMFADFGLAQHLSKELKKPVVNYGFSDTAGAIGYQCFEGGKLVESLQELYDDEPLFESTFRDLPQYDGPERFIHQLLIQLDIYIPVLTPGFKMAAKKISKTKDADRLDVVMAKEKFDWTQPRTYK